MLRSVLGSFLCGVLLLSPLGAAGAPQKSLSWSLDGIEVEGRGDSLAVALTWTFRDWNVPATKAMVFSPAIRKGNNFASLTPVSVYGRKAAQQADRLLASGHKGEQPVVDLSRPVTIRVEDVVPLRDWMDTLRITLSVSDWSKREGLVLRSTSQRGMFLRPEKPADFVFPWPDREPVKESQPYGEVSFWIPVRFASGSSKFDPGAGTDPADLDEFVRRVKLLTSERRLALRSSSLIVTVPPMGVSKETVKLSRNRVTSLYSWMQRHGAFRSVAASRVGGGEDWDGVRAWVEATRYGGDERLMEILSWEGKSDSKAGAIRSEKPVMWDILMKECFPSLGRATYECSYLRPRFEDAEKIRFFYDAMPELLSAHDFWFLAESYGLGTPEWLEIVVAGAALHPNDSALNLDAAFGLMEAGQPDAAAPFLRNAEGDSVTQYAYAMWLFKMGRYDECILRLKDLGSRSNAYDAIIESAVPFIRWQTNHVPWKRYYP